MAVYARGYRGYDGGLKATPPAWTIFRTGVAMAFKRKGYRWMLNLTAFMVVATAGIIYINVIIEDQVRQRGGGMVQIRLFELDMIFHRFHMFTMVLVSLSAVLVGSGLIADDLRSRALSLYLVRPIRPVEYMLGKALILPALLVPMALIPGLLLWLLVGLWQPPGETWTFLQGTSDVAWRIVRFYVVACMELTGLMLLLSSRTPRRGLVIGLSAAVLFGTIFLWGLGKAIQGSVGMLLKSVNVMNNMLWDFTVAWREGQMATRGNIGWGPDGYAKWKSWQPDGTLIWLFCAALLVAGLVLTWRRAHSVEVDA